MTLKYKKGDEFLIKVKIVNTDNAEAEVFQYEISYMPCGNFWVSEKFLDSSERIKRKFENHEYYWIKINKTSCWKPGFFSKKQQSFCVSGCCIVENEIYEIGEHIPTPKE